MNVSKMNAVFIVLIVSYLNLSITVFAAPVQWTAGSGGNDHFYWVTSVGQSSITWQDAKVAAEAEGGYLATITSQSENDFIYGLLQDVKYWSIYWGSPPTGCNGGPWLGGYQADGSIEPYGGWTWITNEPWSFSTWLVGEPNNAGDEKYLNYYGYGTYGASTWNDLGVGVSWIVHAYVVESSTVPEPATMLLFGLGLLGLAGIRRKFKRQIKG